MQDLKILIDRLEELADNADTESVFERAAIFSATKEIERQLLTSPFGKSPDIRDRVKKACFYLCAAIQYNGSEDEPPAQYLEKAEEALESLQSEIDDYNY